MKGGPKGLNSNISSTPSCVLNYFPRQYRMDFESHIEEILKTAMGLDPASIGREAVKRIVHRRMQQCGDERAERYVERLKKTCGELDRLIEAVVVPETWFFRYPESFRFLTDLARAEWLSEPGGRSIRILSAACSTGEE